jgi:hypothetical protein
MKIAQSGRHKVSAGLSAFSLSSGPMILFAIFGSSLRQNGHLNQAI